MHTRYYLLTTRFCLTTQTGGAASTTTRGSGNVQHHSTGTRCTVTSTSRSLKDGDDKAVKGNIVYLRRHRGRQRDLGYGNCQVTRRSWTIAGAAAAGLLTSPRRRVTSQSAAVFPSACSTPRPRRASIRQALTPVTSATVTQNLDLARHRAAAHRACSDRRTEFV